MQSALSPALLIHARLSHGARSELAAVLGWAAPLAGRPLRVNFRASLHAHRGRLVQGTSRGTAVHAGAFIRRREVVLDTGLLSDPGELARILVHELFHFTWTRLGNPARRSWEAVLHREFCRRARGELGWSAEVRKAALRASDRARRSRTWREYVGESFCDTAAWWLAGGRHREFTLPGAFRALRRRWFQHQFKSRIPI